MSRKLLAGTVLLAAGILAGVFGLSSPKPLYARSVSEFLAHPIREQPVRVSGTLVAGSLCRASSSCDYRFSLEGGWPAATDTGPPRPRPELSVHYPACIVPDTFREVPGMDLNVVVEGELCANCHRFEASQILVKCPAKYWIKGYPVHDAVVAPPVRPCAP